MSTFSNNQNISKEELLNLLPKSLVELFDEKDLCFDSPQCAGKNKKEDLSVNSLKFTPSPQIPPLESRLHSYLLRKDTTEDVVEPCNLYKKFSDSGLLDEKESFKSVPQTVKIYELLHEENFFERVLNIMVEW